MNCVGNHEPRKDREVPFVWLTIQQTLGAREANSAGDGGEVDDFGERKAHTFNDGLMTTTTTTAT